MNAKLASYASGNGTISFVWRKDLIAIGRTVTMEEAERYHKNKKHAHLAKFKLVNIDGPCLVDPWTRLNDNTLELDNQKYTYTIHQDKLWPDSKEIGDFAITITAQDEDERVYNVLHAATRASIRHFLQYEKELTEQLAAQV